MSDENEHMDAHKKRNNKEITEIQQIITNKIWNTWREQTTPEQNVANNKEKKTTENEETQIKEMPEIKFKLKQAKKKSQRRKNNEKKRSRKENNQCN